MSKIHDSLVEIKKETKKVKWPNKKDMIKYSFATFVVFFAIFFVASDAILAGLKMLVNR